MFELSEDHVLIRADLLDLQDVRFDVIGHLELIFLRLITGFEESVLKLQVVLEKSSPLLGQRFVPLLIGSQDYLLFFDGFVIGAFCGSGLGKQPSDYLSYKRVNLRIYDTVGKFVWRNQSVSLTVEGAFFGQEHQGI